MELALLTVNCGVARIIGRCNGRPVRSAIAKTPVDEDIIFFGRFGIVGDEQANRAVHGGPDQAVCAYTADHWLWWRNEKNLGCEPGTFGENLTVLGADENGVPKLSGRTWPIRSVRSAFISSPGLSFLNAFRNPSNTSIASRSGIQKA